MYSFPSLKIFVEIFIYTESNWPFGTGVNRGINTDIKAVKQLYLFSCDKRDMM